MAKRIFGDEVSLLKVVVGSWTLVNPRMHVLNNPTRGVDVGSRHAIYRLLRELCDDGMSIVLSSNDLLEDRSIGQILAMHLGRSWPSRPRPTESQPNEQELVAYRA